MTKTRKYLVSLHTKEVEGKRLYRSEAEVWAMSWDEAEKRAIDMAKDRFKDRIIIVDAVRKL